MKTVILSLFAVLMVSASAQAADRSIASCGSRAGGTIHPPKAVVELGSTPTVKTATSNVKATK